MDQRGPDQRPAEGQVRDTRRLIFGAATICVILFAAFLGWSFADLARQALQPVNTTLRPNDRSNQGSGQSIAARQGPVTPQLNPATGGRPQNSNENAREIDSGSAPLELTADQRQKLRALVQKLPTPARVQGQPFTVSIGAAVPRQVPLQQLPSDMVSLLRGFAADEYVLVGTQLVIVDAAVHRVVAIIPDAS